MLNETAAPPQIHYARSMFEAVACLLISLAQFQAVDASPDALSRYRDLTLGASVASVVEQLQVPDADVKVLHDNPSLQQLTWKPHRFISGVTVTADPLAEMVMTFHLGRLVRIVAIYDRERIAGLTDSDLQELLSRSYGPSLLPATASPGGVDVAGAPAGRQPISTWANAVANVTLWREDYPRRAGLTIASTVADRAFQEAMVAASTLAEETAPQREREKAAAAAAEVKNRIEQTRLENKANFKP